MASNEIILWMKKRRLRLSEQIRRSVKNCDLTRYRISKMTGIGESTLSRFVSGERGIPMKTLDRLADALDLNISIGPGYPSGPSKSRRRRTR